MNDMKLERLKIVVGYLVSCCFVFIGIKDNMDWFIYFLAIVLFIATTAHLFWFKRHFIKGEKNDE